MFILFNINKLRINLTYEFFMNLIYKFQIEIVCQIFLLYFVKFKRNTLLSSRLDSNCYNKYFK